MFSDAATMTDSFDYEFVKNKRNIRQVRKNYSVKRCGTGLLEPFQVNWKELTYRAKQNMFSKEKIILNNISGYFTSGKITAIMGPSGSGKSTLLGCISGQKKTGLSGSITISTKRQLKFAFITQDDYLLDKLQIRESLIYASKLKNSGSVDHKMVVNNVIDRLGITKCADIRPKRCSGGQRKRISIALELVSRPNILILDEPTSGLDSVTTWQLITTLIELTKQTEPVAIVATIHQPSAKLFNLFDAVYIMSYDGHCIYHGSPQTMTNLLGEHGLNCPEFHNPSDFVLEIASGEHGIGKVMMLSTVKKIQNLDLKVYENPMKPNRNYRTLSHIWTLTLRSFELTVRDPFLLPMRIFGYIICPILISMLYGPQSGQLSGCPQDLALRKGENFIDKYFFVTNDVNENVAEIAFVCMFGWFGAIFPVLLSFPQEINILFKEYGNGWYSCFSYFMSKVISDIPFQLIIPNLCSFIIYYMTGQYDADSWRIYYFAIISILIAFNSSSLGLMISAWLVDYPTAVAFIGCCTLIPLILFSGFMSRLHSMPPYFRWLSYFNYMRFGLESSLVDIYGFDRCQSISVHNKTDWTQIIPMPALMQIYTSNVINASALLSVVRFFTGEDLDQTKSFALINFELEDNDFYFSIFMLIFIMIGFKVLTYFFIMRKVKSRT